MANGVICKGWEKVLYYCLSLTMLFHVWRFASSNERGSSQGSFFSLARVCMLSEGWRDFVIGVCKWILQLDSGSEQGGNPGGLKSRN